MVSPTGEILTASVSPGWKSSIQRHSVDGANRASIDSTASGVDRLRLYAAGHPVCVSRPGAERRSLLSCGRGALDRVSCRAETARMLAGNGGLLRGPQTLAGGVLLTDRAADGAPARCQGEIGVVVEESTRVRFRRRHRLDAGHLRESTGLSPAASAKTRPRISVDADRGRFFAGLRRCARRG